MLQTLVPVLPDTECQTDYTLEPLDQVAPPARKKWQPIPDDYLHLPGPELDRRIAAAKAALGSRLVILGHHYQRDEIIKWADYRGDSFKLSQLAADRKEAEYIVFCGVHFMAESADILSAPSQKVILPNLAAGCSMADMANIDDVEECWQALTETIEDTIIPITYMNSAANLKAFVGRNGGIVCTSSNAVAVYEWAFQQGKRLLFFPDQHLGRNTGLKFGVPLDEMVVWDPTKPRGGNSPEALRGARIVLWQGWCSTHLRFTAGQIAAARQRFPGARIVVHPECTMEVVQAADENGSTEYINKRISESPPGSIWGVGTEINLVNRIARENPDKTVFCLDPIVCPCSTMYRIHPAYLCWVLEGLVEGKVVNQIVVDDETARWARVALERMLSMRRTS